MTEEEQDRKEESERLVLGTNQRILFEICMVLLSFCLIGVFFNANRIQVLGDRITQTEVEIKVLKAQNRLYEHKATKAELGQ